MTRRNVATCNIKSKTSSDVDTCVGMYVTNPYSPIVDPLETRSPDPKVWSRNKSTSSSEGQPRAVTTPRRARPMHDLRSGRGRRMTKTSTSHSSREAKSTHKLGLTDKDFVTLTSTLTGFIGDFVSPLGATMIPVTFGGEPRSKTLMVSFMIVKLPSAYNVIIGRPTLNRLKAVVSTYHRLLKFPTRAGVGEVRSDPRESRQCYLTATTLSKKPKVQSAATVPQNPKDSAQDPHPVEQGMENSQADALARLASSCTTDTSRGGTVRTTGPSVNLGVLAVDEKEGS
ncbi:hypothetical protein BHE74_00054381 [Ensete ventricosum]|nr:hypothetical protein BHE74_00054381 [Ensete ventricosum]